MRVITAVFLCLLLAACGAKTKQELIQSAKISERHTINKNYQAVYKGIADKFVECAGGFAQNIQRNLYPEIGEGEFYSAGADSSGYLFIVEVKKAGDDSTTVSSYSKISFGMYPDLIEMVRYVAEEKEGCPK